MPEGREELIRSTAIVVVANAYMAAAFDWIQLRAAEEDLAVWRFWVLLTLVIGLLLVIGWLGERHEVGLRWPPSLSDPWVAATIAALAIALGFAAWWKDVPINPLGTINLALSSFALVLLCHGVFFRGAECRFGVWRATWITTPLFVLTAWLLDFGSSLFYWFSWDVLRVLVASALLMVPFFLFSPFLSALRVRLDSIVPSTVAMFMFNLSPLIGGTLVSGFDFTLESWLREDLPRFLLVLPLTGYAVWLLRDARAPAHEPQPSSDVD